MDYYPRSIKNLIATLARLPGIGRKTAERLAMHILQQPAEDAHQLARSIVDLKKKLRLCSRCFALSDDVLCRICNDPARESGLICVVEQPADMASIEKSGAFKGRYHILGGVLSPMDGIGPDDIKIAELVARVEKEDVNEIILATGTNVEGESTAAYIAGGLGSMPVTVTRIASGVPMGGDLKKAPKGKKAPTFMVFALRDPVGANLDRIQIVKGWMDKDGKTHEKVYDVSWSGDRKPDANGKLPEVGNTVDLEAANWSNTIGASELTTVWTDPDFDSKQNAFYYARVIEIPTPRWTTIDAFRFGIDIPEGAPVSTQERAYTSPIWHKP